MRSLTLVILASLAKKAGLTEADLNDARKMLAACEQALDGGRSGDVLPAIYHSRYDGPVRPWLDAIAIAIDAADLDPVERASITGAFRVAAMVVEDGVVARQQRARRA